MTDKIRYITPEDNSSEAAEKFRLLDGDTLDLMLDMSLRGAQILRDNPEWYLGREINCSVGLDQNGKAVFDTQFVVQEIIEHEGSHWAVGSSHDKGDGYHEWPVGSKYAIDLEGSLVVIESILAEFGRSLDEEVTNPEVLLALS